MNLRWHVFVLVLGLSTRPLQALQTLDTVVVRGATIIDGRGGTPIRDGVIVIASQRIVAVGPRGSVPPRHTRSSMISGRWSPGSGPIW